MALLCHPGPGFDLGYDRRTVTVFVAGLRPAT